MWDMKLTSWWALPCQNHLRRPALHSSKEAMIRVGVQISLQTMALLGSTPAVGPWDAAHELRAWLRQLPRHCLHSCGNTEEAIELLRRRVAHHAQQSHPRIAPVLRQTICCSNGQPAILHAASCTALLHVQLACHV